MTSMHDSDVALMRELAEALRAYVAITNTSTFQYYSDRFAAIENARKALASYDARSRAQPMSQMTPKPHGDGVLWGSDDGGQTWIAVGKVGE